MKTIFNNKMVRHVWAQRNQEEGRNGNGSLSFIGDTLYSYQTPIANFVENHEGRLACLITTNTYSVTTSGKHIPHTMDIPNAVVFHVPYIGKSGGRAGAILRTEEVHNKNYIYFVEKHAELILKIARAKNIDWLLRELDLNKQNALAYCNFFALREYRAADFPQISSELLESVLAEAKKEAQAKAEKTKRENARKQKELQKEIDVFLAGGELPNASSNAFLLCNKSQKVTLSNEFLRRWKENQINTIPYNFLPDTIVLRVKNENVETSRGASFPVEHAKKAFPFVRRCREHKVTWHTNGHKIPLGLFQIDKIDETGAVFAGCHKVDYAEIESLAKTLNLI